MNREQQRRVLVVDDEPRLAHVVRINLELEGFRVASAANGREALALVTEQLPDLVVLDVMMPEMDGFEVLRRIRELSDVPVIMLTVKGEESDRVLGLDSGADDYITKPFSNRELISRVKAVLRRTERLGTVPKTVVKVDDDLSIDFGRSELLVRGDRVPLRPTEYRLLYHLVSNAGMLLSNETLLARVWGHDYREEKHYVRLYITYLRQKIEEDPKNPQYILNERGLGYRFKEFPWPQDAEVPAFVGGV